MLWAFSGGLIPFVSQNILALAALILSLGRDSVAGAPGRHAACAQSQPGEGLQRGASLPAVKWNAASLNPARCEALGMGKGA